MTRRPWQKSSLTLGTRLDGAGDLKLSPSDRESHLYIAGATRTGKSKLIESLIRQDIAGWRRHKCGMLLIDPHGDLYRQVMKGGIAKGKTGLPIVPIDLTDKEYIVSYNVLRKQSAETSALVRAFVRAMAYIWGADGTDTTPRFERWLTHLLHALYQLNHTLVEAPRMLSPYDQRFRRNAIPQLTGPVSEHWQWACTLPQKQFQEQIESTINRLQRFQDCEKLNLMLGTHGHTFDFEQAIEEGWIVLVNLSTEGSWGDEEDADTLATLMLTDLWTSAKARGKSKNNRPFRVVIDEFQNFITPTIAKNLAQAAGFGLHLTLATQFPTQLLSAGKIGEDIYRNVMGNARSKVVFSLEEPDSLKALTEWLFRSSLNPDEVKHDLYSTKALGQKLVTLENRSETTTTSESDGLTETDDSDGGHMSSSTRDQTSTSKSTSTSSTEAFATIYGKELSSRQFRSVEEQYFMATQRIVSQNQRHAFVRAMSMKEPVPIITPLVEEGLAREPYVQKKTHEMLEKLPFAHRVESARKQLAERQAVIDGVNLDVLDEPMTAKRRIR